MWRCVPVVSRLLQHPCPTADSSVPVVASTHLMRYIHPSLVVVRIDRCAKGFEAVPKIFMVISKGIFGPGKTSSGLSGRF
jgi:hypothetical protein